MKRTLIIILAAIVAAFFLSSCNLKGSDGQNGINGKDGIEGGWTDATTDTPLTTVSNPSGFAEAGPFQGYSEVTMWPLDASYKQTGSPFVGNTRADDSGQFVIYADITSENVKTKVMGEAYNETNNSFDGNVGMESTVPTSAGSFNANYATSIVSIVGNYWYHEDVSGNYYQDNSAFTAAETAVLSYFDYSGLWDPAVKKSYEMTLTGDTTDDAKLVLINSTIALGKTGPQQGTFMREIAEDIYTAANARKAEVNSITEGLKIKKIKDNLDNYYAVRGLDYDCAPVQNLPGVPSYYAGLLNEVQTIQGSFNLDDPGSCSFDMPYKRYAIPHIFESWIETSNYIAHNLGEGVSIWSRGVHGGGYDAPGIKLVEVEELRENLLDSALPSHGMITGHSLNAGDEIYFVIEREVAFVLSTGCEGGLLPWGRKLASNDGGVTYIGWNNDTEYFRKSGVKLEGIQ